MSDLEKRIEKLEQRAHEPFDFTHLIQRLERLEAALVPAPDTGKPGEADADLPTAEDVRGILPAPGEPGEEEKP